MIQSSLARNKVTSAMIVGLVICDAVDVARAGRIALISQSVNSGTGDARSRVPAISGSGRSIAFSSDASDLSEQDQDNRPDIFVREVHMQEESEIVSVRWNGEQSEQACESQLALSVDGRFVVFSAYAEDLVEDDSNAHPDIFMRDRLSRTTVRLNVTEDGRQMEENGALLPTCNLDGRYVCFSAASDELVEGDKNGQSDVVIKDTWTGKLFLASVASDGTQGNNSSGLGQSEMSADGRFIVFMSDATNLVGNDRNKLRDVFVHDRQEGTTVRASVRSDGRENDDASSNVGITADGRYVCFSTGGRLDGDYDDLGDIYLRDLQERKTILVSGKANGSCSDPDLSADGRFIALRANASNLDERCKVKSWQVYLLDRQTGKYTLASVNDNDEPGNGTSERPKVSANGRFVTFVSQASNLVEGDDNGVEDVFVIEMRPCSDFLKGDSNCDGAVDLADIDAFMLALIDEGEYVLQNLSCDWECNNDINGDETVDFNDIDGFVECLINGACE